LARPDENVAALPLSPKSRSNARFASAQREHPLNGGCEIANPEDLALAILAEIVAQDRGRELGDIRDQDLTGADARDPKARVGRAESPNSWMRVLALVWTLSIPACPVA
jgi:hypothetical protein